MSKGARSCPSQLHGRQRRIAWRSWLSLTKAVEFLKGRLKTHLEATEQQKLRTKRFNIAVCANGGKAPLRFDNTPPEQMPERFKRVTVEPDREAIRTALEAGEELSFAYLAERESHLRIK